MDALSVNKVSEAKACLSLWWIHPTWWRLSTISFVGFGSCDFAINICNYYLVIKKKDPLVLLVNPYDCHSSSKQKLINSFKAFCT